MADNPVNQFLNANQQRNLQRREETQNLWHNWHQNGRTPTHLEPLLDNFGGLVGQKMKEWRPPSIPKAAFEAELTKHVIKAIETYDPNMGASLNTHVNHRIKKAKRYMVQQQNLARIPEEQAYRIGDIQRTQDELFEQFGRKATHAEIGTHLGMPEKRVATIIKSMRRDIPSSRWESDPEATQISQQSQREHEILPLIRDTLNTQEQQVFDHIYGHNGTPVISGTGQLSKRLGMSPSQVSRLKTSIGAKYKSYL